MDTWRKCCVPKEMSLIDVLKNIDTYALQLALIVSDENRLLGIVTDGDIRRGLISGMKLSMPVEYVMNKKPIVAHVTQDKMHIAMMMREYRLHHIPVLDEADELVNLYTLEDLVYVKKRDNIVVLMAGGLGTRLRPLTESTPKPLLKVGNKPILEIIIDNFISAGFYRFYISVNYKSEMIEQYFGDGSRFGVKIKYIHEKKRMGTAGALFYLPKSLNKPIIVMNGDLLTKVDFGEFIDYHMKQNAVATMGVREYSYQIPYGVIDYDGVKIVKITEKPTKTYYINAGMYVLSPKAVACVDEEKYIDMPDLFNQFLTKNKKTTVYPVREYWMDIGRIDDFKQAQIDYGGEFDDNAD